MKNNNPFISGFIYGVIFTLVIGGICVFYYKIVAEFKYHHPAKVSAPAGPIVPVNINAAPVKGKSNAPVTVTEYADFFCGYCKKSMPVMQQISRTYPDKVRQVFKNFPLSNTPGQGSFRAHEAGVCAQEQGKFWEFYEKVFSSASNPDDAGLQSIATQAGMNIQKYNDCLRSGRATRVIQADLAEGRSKGVEGTPHFLINDTAVGGYQNFEKFQQIIDSYLKTGKPPASKPAPPAVKVDFNDLKGRPFLGPDNAPVTLVEFSDYHCPFCQRLDVTLKKIMADYSGKVRLIWRHFPLAMHAGAERTHQAAECAHEQNKFWSFHNLLFTGFKQSWTDADYEVVAKESGLNVAKFKTCMQNDKSKKTVQQDIIKGNSAGVRGTPAVFLNGTLMPGAQPYESYKAAIDAALKQPEKK